MPYTAQARRSDATGIAGYNPTFYFDLTAGFSTAKSQLILNNDTSTSATYTIGGNAGLEHEYGFYVKNDTNATGFELNQSTTAMAWQDTGVRYRMGFFYLGLVFSLLEMQANREGADLLDAGGSGMGGNVGFIIPLGRPSVLYLDVVSVTMAKSRNTLTQEVTFGARQDVDIGACINITRRLLDFLVGFRQRTLAVTADTSGTETLYTTYIGLRMAAFF